MITKKSFSMILLCLFTAYSNTQAQIKVWRQSDTLVTAGWYKVFFNSYWNVTDSSDERASFYRLIRINEKGLPCDTVRDYYMEDGRMQWKGQLSGFDFRSDRNTVIEGYCITYDKSGAADKREYYENGIKKFTVWGDAEGVLRVGKDGYQGFITHSGEVITPCVYQNAKDFSEGYAAVKTNKLFGFVNKAGKEVVPPQFDDVLSFHGSLAAVQKDHLWGYINRQGSLVLPYRYHEAENFSTGSYHQVLACVGIYRSKEEAGDVGGNEEDENTGIGVILSRETDSAIVDYVIPGGPASFSGVLPGDKIIMINGGYIFRRYDILNKLKGSKGSEVVLGIKRKGVEFLSYRVIRGDIPKIYKGCINTSGKIVVPFLYDNLHLSSGPLILVSKNNKYGYINETGESVIPRIYADAEDFSSGLAAVKSNEKWGYINSSGKVVISFKYSQAKNFNYGLAPVEFNGQWGYLDKSGYAEIPFIYGAADPFISGKAFTYISLLEGTLIKKQMIDTTGEPVGCPEFLFPQGQMMSIMKLMQKDEQQSQPEQEEKYFAVYFDKRKDAIGWGYAFSLELAKNNALKNCISHGGRDNAELIQANKRTRQYGAFAVALDNGRYYWSFGFSYNSVSEAEDAASGNLQNTYGTNGSSIISSWSPGEIPSSGYSFPTSKRTTDSSFPVIANNVLDAAIGVLNNSNSQNNSNSGNQKSGYDNPRQKPTRMYPVRNCVDLLECYEDNASTKDGYLADGLLAREQKVCISKNAVGQATFKADSYVYFTKTLNRGDLAFDQYFTPAGSDTPVKFKGGTKIWFISDENDPNVGKVAQGNLAEGATIQGRYYQAGVKFVYYPLIKHMNQ